MAIGEFALIDRFFTRPLADREDIRIGIGDDGAVLAIAADRRLVTTLATAGEAAWNRTGGDATHLGNDVMAAALNRLAAAGAQPAYATLALTLPEADERWLEGFSNALFAVATPAGAALVGGDTTRGPFAATVVGHGLIASAMAETAAHPRAGDGVYVSGTLAMDATPRCVPSPIPVALGGWIRAHGGVAADLSEGLEAALAALLAAHGLGTSLALAGLPLAEGDRADTLGWPALARQRGHMELCFTLDAALHGPLLAQAETLGVRVTRLARVDDSGERRLVAPDGSVLPPYCDGWSDSG